ncbi:MAG: hypothetical protein BGO62_08720 [Thiobacillus sp. 65-1402]|nr:MAG: hypothetical protein BGO62_08720 [Thiobacillus sp. 65-1402]
MAPWGELAFRTLISMTGVTVATFAFVWSAEWLREKFRGRLKDVIRTTYVAIFASCLVLAPFMYLITAAQGMALGDDGLFFLAVTGVAWLLTMALMLFVNFSLVKRIRNPEKQ